jgi:hypothetical protein
MEPVFKFDWRREFHEGEFVMNVFRRRIRLYLGHSANAKPRLRKWKSTLGSTGIYVVLWNSRVLGIQWRRNDI